MTQKWTYCSNLKKYCAALTGSQVAVLSHSLLFIPTQTTEKSLVVLCRREKILESVQSGMGMYEYRFDRTIQQIFSDDKNVLSTKFPVRFGRSFPHHTIAERHHYAY